MWTYDHVHVKDAVLVKFVNDGFWWDANGGNEEFGTAFDDDVDEFAELAFGVVICYITNKHSAITHLRLSDRSYSLSS